MTMVRLGSVSLDCADPAALAHFWSQLLDGEVVMEGEDFVAVRLANVWLTTMRVENFVAPTWPEGDVGKQMHLDLAVKDLDAVEGRAVALGAVKATHQPAPELFRVLLDPAGHPFCITTMIPD